MSKRTIKIIITTITDIADLIDNVNYFCDNMTGELVSELPNLNNALEEWKQKNFSLLSPQEFNDFIKIKKRVENLMDEFKITTTWEK